MGSLAAIFGVPAERVDFACCRSAALPVACTCCLLVLLLRVLAAESKLHVDGLWLAAYFWKVRDDFGSEIVDLPPPTPPIPLPSPSRTMTVIMKALFSTASRHFFYVKFSASL
jgi:hypothetical protein